MPGQEPGEGNTHDAMVHAPRNLSLTRIALRALLLLIVLPTLGVLYLFWDDLDGRVLPLAFLFVLSGLGFYLCWTVIHSVMSVLRGLERVWSGESSSVELEDGPHQLREMAEIINALNKLTIEFRENAAQLESLIEQFATLAELTEITARIPDINELLRLVLRKAMASTHARFGAVKLLGEDGSGLVTVAVEGGRAGNDRRVSVSDNFARMVIESGRPLLVEDVNDVYEICPAMKDAGYASPSFLVMPLMAKAATIGVVLLAEKATARPFSSQDQQFLTVMLGQIGYAVENARLLKQARDAAERLKEAVEHKEIQLQDAQRQIIQSEKLSALGQLVAGVAHEINNPLTCVCGYTEIILESNQTAIADEHTRNMLRTVLDEAQRATRIVQNLLSFARERKPEKKQANINDVVRRVLDIRHYDLKTRGIQVDSALEENLPATMVDVDQIQQVILNLINNAAQALQDDGPRRIEIGTRSRGDIIETWVADTGEGIPRTLLDRIFDPFFSTKGNKTNSGLGLSISYGIVKQHGGEIAVDSAEHKGTRMTVRLPIVRDAGTTSQAEVRPGKRFQPVRNLSALVVDDEEAVADLVGTVLRMAGYDTTVCTSGTEGMERIRERDYDIVICDLRMPHLDGKEVYRRAKEQKPDLARRFLLTSGDIADPGTKQFAQENGIRMIAKPFTQKGLLESVREAVESLGSGQGETKEAPASSPAD